MFDITWNPSVDFASGLTAYYERREEHYRKFAEAIYREWQEQFSLAEKYRLLAEKAAVDEKLAV